MGCDDLEGALVTPPRNETLGLNRHGRIRFAPMIAGLVVLAAVVMVTLRFSELSEFASLARSAHPSWLLLAVVAQALTYVCATAVWRLALDRAGYPLPLRRRLSCAR